MPRRKAAENCSVKPWVSGKGDCKEKRFLLVGNSLLFSPAFKKLKSGAQYLYICMAMDCGGKPEFTFTQSSAKKYGIAPATFWRRIKDLKDAGFISSKSGANLQQPNDYKFEYGWKEKPP